MSYDGDEQKNSVLTLEERTRKCGRTTRGRSNTKNALRRTINDNHVFRRDICGRMIENICFDGFRYYDLSRRSLRRVFILGQLHMKRKRDKVFILDMIF